MHMPGGEEGAARLETQVKGIPGLTGRGARGVGPAGKRLTRAGLSIFSSTEERHVLVMTASKPTHPGGMV